MNLYLVRGTVERRKYEIEGVERFEDIRLVKAVSEEKAAAKWSDYWNCDRGTVYYDSYYASALNATVTGVLE